MIASLADLADMEMQARRLGIDLPDELTFEDRQWVAAQLELAGARLIKAPKRIKLEMVR